MYFFCHFYDIKTEMFLNYKQNYNKRLNNWSCVKKKPKRSNTQNACFLIRYEQEGKGRKTIKAQQLWYAVIEAQTETGTPYMLYKDHCNRKSNQQNLGTIKCSNLCTEIVEYSSPDEVREREKKMNHIYTIYKHYVWSKVWLSFHDKTVYMRLTLTYHFISVSIYY